MLIDSQNEFSQDQAITATAASTNIIDLSLDRDIGKGEPVPILVQVTTTFTAAGAATLTVDLETDDNSSFSSATNLWTSGAIGKATLVAGYKFLIHYMPRANEQYLRLNYTVATGPMTAGKIQACIASEDQTNESNV